MNTAKWLLDTQAFVVSRSYCEAKEVGKCQTPMDAPAQGKRNCLVAAGTHAK